MAVAGNIVVNMRANTAGLEAGAKRAKASLSSLQSSVNNMKRALLGLVGAYAGVQGTRAIGGMVMMAADLEETISRNEVVFGAFSDTVTKSADDMAAKFGTVKKEFADAAGLFGIMFKGAGKTQQQAALLGVQLAKLGMDLASFFNATNEEVFAALAAGLRGEFDPLERFGVFLTADAIKAEMLAKKMNMTTAEALNQSKKMASLNLILGQTKDAQGDLERTQDSTKNQWKKLTGELTNLGASIGSVLVPAFRQLVSALNDTVNAGKRLGNENWFTRYSKATTPYAMQALNWWEKGSGIAAPTREEILKRFGPPGERTDLPGVLPPGFNMGAAQGAGARWGIMNQFARNAGGGFIGPPDLKAGERDLRGVANAYQATSFWLSSTLRNLGMGLKTWQKSIEKTKEATQALRDFNRENWGVATAAEFGSEAALTAIARSRRPIEQAGGANAPGWGERLPGALNKVADATSSVMRFLPALGIIPR